MYFGYIERTTNGRSEYFPDTPSESNSYSMETSSNSALRVIIKVENNGEVFYYNLVKDQFRFEGRKNELLSYKNVPEGFEVHNAAGAYTDLLEPYGNLKYGAKCITDEEEIQQRFGSFIDKYVGEEDTVSFFELFLCDGDGNVVDVPKEYQLMTTYEIDFPASHMYNFPVGGGWPSSIPRIYRWRNEAKVYDMTDDSSKLLAVIDGETYTDLKTLKFNHIPSGTFAVVNSGLEMAKYLKYEWIDENVIKIMPVGVQGESILFMSSYDRGGRYLSSTEPIAVPAKLNAASDLGNNSVIFNGYEFDVRQEPNAKKVRFFLWDSINRMEPICNSVEIELE